MTSSTGLFKKLSVTHNLSAPQGGEYEYSFGEVRDGTYQGIYYNNAPDLSNLIPAKYRHHFFPQWMTIITDYVPPHIDNGMGTAINFYVETADAETTFHATKSPYRRKRLHNQTNGYVVHQDDVTPLASFVAQPGDVYVLNVGRLHSVKSRQKALRVAFQLATELPYDEVLELLGVPDDLAA